VSGNAVKRLADESAARLRRGKRPSPAEDTWRYPDPADDIRRAVYEWRVRLEIIF
jgi:hypothetical protein